MPFIQDCEHVYELVYSSHRAVAQEWSYCTLYSVQSYINDILSVIFGHLIIALNDFFDHFFFHQSKKLNKHFLHPHLPPGPTKGKNCASDRNRIRLDVHPGLISDHLPFTPFFYRLFRFFFIIFLKIALKITFTLFTTNKYVPA